MELNYDMEKSSTEKAILIAFGDDLVWVPRSLIEEMTEDTVTIKEWFVLENELEVYEA